MRMSLIFRSRIPFQIHRRPCPRLVKVIVVTLITYECVEAVHDRDDTGQNKRPPDHHKGR